MYIWDCKWFRVKTKRSEIDRMLQPNNERRVINCTHVMFYFDNAVNNMNMIQGEVEDYRDVIL